MSDILSKRVNELEAEVIELRSVIEKMEEQLIVLYKEKDLDYTSELTTAYQTEIEKNLEEKN